MRAQSGIFNLLTLLVLAASAVAILACAVLFLVPAAVPGFLRLSTEPAQVAVVTPMVFSSPTVAISYPTLPPQWTATLPPTPTTTPTPGPTETPTETPSPTDTESPFTQAPTSSPTTTAGPANSLKTNQLTNVRTGPSTAYPVVAQLQGGVLATVVGIDKSGAWFAINSAAAPGGIGWVSASLVTFGGDVKALTILQPSGPPPTPRPAPPTSTHGPPTATPLPNLGGAGGLQTIQFFMHKTTGVVGEHIFFTFEVKNNSGSTISNYGILAAHTDQGYTADSWHAPLAAGEDLKWDDWIGFSATGTYQVYLGICFASHDACKSGGAAWTRLSPSTTVTITASD